MRDSDKTILQYLTQAQSCIHTIHGQHQHSLKVNQDIEKRHLFGSTEDLNKTMTSTPSSGPGNKDKYGTLAANHVSSPSVIRQQGGRRGPLRSNGELCTSPTMLTPVTLNVNDETLSSFLGEQTQSKNSSKPQKFLFEIEEQGFGNSQQGGNGNNRHSAVSEIQRLRQQLNEETKRELENFDKAFDTPKLQPQVDEDKKAYRYSILNRMDEILNNKLEGSGGHVRQYSEPSMSASVSEYVISSRNQPKRTHPKQDFHSFRYPPNSSSKPVMTRSDSAGVPKHGAGGTNTHYDTTVIGKRKSRPSSRNSTLERQHKQPLQYSIESMDEHSGSDDISISSGHESPEHMYGADIHPELSPLSPLLNQIDIPFSTAATKTQFNGFDDYLRNSEQSPSRSVPLSRKHGGKDISWL